MAACSITLTQSGASCELTVTGDVDMAITDDLAAMGRLGLTNPGAESLVVDLRGVSFIDSSGLAALISIRNAAQTLSKDLQLCNLPRCVVRLLALAGLSGVFSVATADPPADGSAQGVLAGGRDSAAWPRTLIARLDGPGLSVSPYVAGSAPG